MVYLTIRNVLSDSLPRRVRYVTVLCRAGSMSILFLTTFGIVCPMKAQGLPVLPVGDKSLYWYLMLPNLLSLLFFLMDDICVASAVRQW